MSGGEDRGRVDRLVTPGGDSGSHTDDEERGLLRPVLHPRSPFPFKERRPRLKPFISDSVTKDSNRFTSLVGSQRRFTYKDQGESF